MINTIIVTNRYWQHTERMEDCHLICVFVSTSRWAWNTYTVLEGTAAAQQMRKREQVKFISHCKSKVAQPKHELSRKWTPSDFSTIWRILSLAQIYCSELLTLSYDTVACTGSAGVGTSGNLTLQLFFGDLEVCVEGLFLELVCTSLKRSFRLKPKSPHLHFVESFYTSAEGSFEYRWNLWFLQVNRAHGNCCVDNFKAPVYSQTN